MTVPRIEPFTVPAGTPPLDAVESGIYSAMDTLRDLARYLRGTFCIPASAMSEHREEVETVADGLATIAVQLNQFSVMVHNAVCEPENRVRVDDSGQVVADANSTYEAMRHSAAVKQVRHFDLDEGDDGCRLMGLTAGEVETLDKLRSGMAVAVEVSHPMEDD